MSLLPIALAAYEAGVCVLPPKEDGSKCPIVPWTEYQSRRATMDEIRRWYGDGRRTGLGIVLGATSGNLELLEFDDVATYGRFKTLAETAGLGELVDRIESGYLEHSPNGIHWLYRCEEVGTNTKLARRPEGEGIKVLVETRGEGGFAIVAPTFGKVHNTGRSYDLKAGGWDHITTISTSERAALFDLARTLDAMPRRQQRSRVALAQPRTAEDEERPGDWFNRTRRWDDVLEPYGWTFLFDHRGEGYWRRPGKEDGQSATTNYADSDLLKVFSSSTPFDTETAYTKFAAYAVLAHDGDFSSAASALAGEMPERSRGSSANTPPPPRDAPPEEDDYVAEWDGTGAPEDDEIPVVEEEAEPPPPALLVVRTISDAFANPPTQPDTLINGMLRHGELCVLGAPRAIGKSWFGMNLAVLAGRGEGLLGGNLAVAQRCNTLYCQGELDEWESYRRWYMLGTGKASPGVFETFDRWRLRVVTRRGSSSGRDAGTGGGWAESEEHMDASLDARLEATIQACDIDIVVIDPWAVYYAGKENSNDEVEAALDKLRHLAMRYGVAIVILHHLGKSTEAREPEDLWRGASRLPDWASTRITMLPHYTDSQAEERGMTRMQARRYADVFFLRRSDPTEGFSMRLDPKSGWWEGWQADGGVAPVAVVMAPADVVKRLEESGGWGSLREAATAMDCSPHTAEKLLSRALKAGAIVELAGPRGSRRFSLPSAPKRQLPDPEEDF